MPESYDYPKKGDNFDNQMMNLIDNDVQTLLEMFDDEENGNWNNFTIIDSGDNSTLHTESLLNVMKINTDSASFTFSNVNSKVLNLRFFVNFFWSKKYCTKY